MHINVVIPATMYVAIVAIGVCCTQNDLGVAATVSVGCGRTPKHDGGLTRSNSNLNYHPVAPPQAVCGQAYCCIAIGYVWTLCPYNQCCGQSFGQYARKLTDVHMLFRTLLLQ